MNNELVETIGLDLGHGETAVARVMLESNAQPEMLEIHGRKTQVTAIGIHPQRGIVIGEQALTMPGITRLEVGFKRKSTEDPAYRETLRQFLGAYYHLLLESGQIQGGGASRFLIGCPSGWSGEERQSYEKLLRESAIPNLTVVPESRAALMHAKESGKFKVEELRSPTLIVDIGSLTTDLTLLENLAIQPKDFGDNSLGGGLIDKAILAYTLESPEAATLKPILEQHHVYYARCELECRRVKERYFSDEKLYEDPDSRVEGRVRIVTGNRDGTTLTFEPAVNAPTMRDILRRPIEVLGGKTWAEAFRDLLMHARARLERDAVTLKVLLITGGASRMSFTHEIACEVFPESSIRPDSEPEFCIARGLSRLGRWQTRTAAFRAKVDEFCASEQIEETIKRRNAELVERLAKTAATGLVQNAVKPALLAWRNGRIRTLAELEPQTAELAKTWIASTQGREGIHSECAQWSERIQADLSHRTSALCQEFQLPAGALALDVAPDLSGVDTGKLPAIGDPAELTNITTMVIAVVIASVLGGGGTALLMHGPIGWVIGLGVGLYVANVGAEAAKDQMKRIEIPDLARGLLLSEGKIDAKCREMLPDLEKHIMERLSEDTGLLLELATKIRAQIQAGLQARAEQALLMIQ